jgi:hypothetical protein
MNRKPQVDPIEHAWRHCNPDAPLPSPLAERVVLSTMASAAEPSRMPDETSETATHEPHRRRPRHQGFG